jgi:hypothetical protein
MKLNVTITSWFLAGTAVKMLIDSVVSIEIRLYMKTKLMAVCHVISARS